MKTTNQSQPRIFPAFTLERVRVVRDFTHVKMGEGKQTIGEMIDSQILDTLEHGEELQDIAVHFESSQCALTSEASLMK